MKPTLRAEAECRAVEIARRRQVVRSKTIEVTARRLGSAELRARTAIYVESVVMEVMVTCLRSLFPLLTSVSRA